MHSLRDNKNKIGYWKTIEDKKKLLKLWVLCFWGRRKYHVQNRRECEQSYCLNLSPTEEHATCSCSHRWLNWWRRYWVVSSGHAIVSFAELAPHNPDNIPIPLQFQPEHSPCTGHEREPKVLVEFEINVNATKKKLLTLICDYEWCARWVLTPLLP